MDEAARQMQARLSYTPQEVAALLGVPRTAVYDAIWRGDLRALKLGGRLLIAAAALDEVLARDIDFENEQRRGGKDRGVEHLSGGDAQHASSG